MPRRLSFPAALSDEPPGVRAAVQEATSTLSRAFVQQHTPGAGAGDGNGDGNGDGGDGGADTDQLDELLLESVTSPKVRVSVLLHAPCMVMPELCRALTGAMSVRGGRQGGAGKRNAGPAVAMSPC